MSILSIIFYIILGGTLGCFFGALCAQTKDADEFVRKIHNKKEKE